MDISLRHDLEGQTMDNIILLVSFIYTLQQQIALLQLRVVFNYLVDIPAFRSHINILACNITIRILRPM